MNVSFKHEYLASNECITTVAIRRGAHPISARAEALFAKLLSDVFAPGSALPAVVKYHELRAKSAHIGSDVRVLQLEVDRATIDREKAILELSGEKLAATLSKIEQKRAAAVQRIADTQAGVAVFQQHLKDAEAEARAALREFTMDALGRLDRVEIPKVIADVQRSQACLEALQVAADEAAVAERVRDYLGAKMRTGAPEMTAAIMAGSGAK